jgi:hypothetical protein
MEMDILGRLCNLSISANAFDHQSTPDIWRLTWQNFLFAQVPDKRLSLTFCNKKGEPPGLTLFIYNNIDLLSDIANPFTGIARNQNPFLASGSLDLM